MDISCVICSDLFTPISQIIVNKCGHVFHNECLIKWIERSKTCPQCRSAANNTTICRVYFNITNIESIVDNVVTLQSKLDNANYKLTVKERDLKSLLADKNEMETKNIKLKKMVQELEEKDRTRETLILNFKDKLKEYKLKCKEFDRIQSENTKLKTDLSQMEKCNTVIWGARNEVEEILKTERSIESLALISATLKKNLLNLEQKNNKLQKELRHSQNETVNFKRLYVNSDTSLKDLSKILADNSKSWEEEKAYLKNKLKELSQKSIDKNADITNNSSLNRILTESPAPLPRRRELATDINSPTVEEKVNIILESESPYLTTKTNYSSLLDGNYIMKHNNFKKNSIFTNRNTMSVQKEPSTSSDTVYTGLGGQVKEDLMKFPERKFPLKRSKSSTITSKKFKKLGPLNNFNKKITDFIED